MHPVDCWENTSNLATSKISDLSFLTISFEKKLKFLEITSAEVIFTYSQYFT